MLPTQSEPCGHRKPELINNKIDPVVKRNKEKPRARMALGLNFTKLLKKK
jgi:hypothetical protein